MAEIKCNVCGAVLVEDSGVYSCTVCFGKGKEKAKKVVKKKK